MKIRIASRISTQAFAFIALIIFGAPTINAAPGDLDLSFGSGGVVVTPIISSLYYEIVPRSILTQPNGKIVVCGWIFDGLGSNDSFFLARYHPNGKLDASFGRSGKIIAPFSDGPQVGTDIAWQPDGKIITVGWGGNPGSGFAVYRYNPNGTLDDSFGATGVVITLVGTGSLARSVAVQADGKIVVAGVGNNNTAGSNFAVVRYHPNGSLDSSFNGTGLVITSFGGGSAASAVVLQPDGKIVATGATNTGSSTNAFALARYNTDGSLDSSFGVGGKVIHAVSVVGYNSINDAALQLDGKIVATGAGAISRYNTNGTIDTTFAKTGVFTTDANFNVGNSIALQSDGKFLAFGIASNPSGSAVARLNPNGTPDTSFGVNGRVIAPNHGTIASGAVQSDGKILALNSAFGSAYGFEILRFLGDSAAPRPTQFDFDRDGKSDISVFRASDRTWYLNLSSAGFAFTQFGLSTDRITPADFDGDGKTDIAVYRDGTWYWLNSSNGNFNSVQFGLAIDLPVPADFTGDGRAELAVYRGGVWWWLDLSNNQVGSVQFGLPSDKPVVADYDGDGRADQAVFRDGVWHLNRSSQGYTAVSFGISTDKPVPADYDGDGRTDPAVYRNGNWYLQQSTNGFTAFQFGLAKDLPAPADYDGDGKTDAAVYRDGTWYLRQSTGGLAVQQFGLANDRPIPEAFLP